MKNSYLIFQSVLALLLITLVGCDNYGKIKGNHNVEKETRQMVSFESVINEGSFNVYISNGSNHEVILEAESNIIPYIRTVVHGNSLEIDTKENIKPNSPINIYVKSPLVKFVAMEGSGVIMFDSLASKEFRAEIDGSGIISGKLLANSVYATINGSGNISFEMNCSDIVTEINGSGNINLLGRTDKVTHEIDGSGNINAFEFIANDCAADVGGSGNMNLNVTGHLNVNISGSGSVYYMGTPQMNVVITGSGSVIKL